MYALQDANWNVVALAATNGVIQERCSYSAYGTPLFLDAGFSPKTVSGYDWETLYAGYRLEPVGLYQVRNRFLHPRLGIWVSRDPIGYLAGDVNLYRYVGNEPTIYTDPGGLGNWVWPWAANASWNPADTGALWFGGPSGGDWLDRNFGGPQWTSPEGRDLSGKIVSCAADLGSFAPIAGEIADGGELIRGCDSAGMPLSTGERILTGVGLCIPLVPGRAIRKAGKIVIGDGAAAAASAGRGITATDVITAGATPARPNRIYSARELIRRSEEPGPFHNFPESFNNDIFGSGTRTVTPNFWQTAKPGLSNNSIMYKLPGSVNGYNGTFEIGVRPSISGNTEVIMHRFFRPKP